MDWEINIPAEIGFHMRITSLFYLVYLVFSFLLLITFSLISSTVHVEKLTMFLHMGCSYRAIRLKTLF